MSYLNKRLDRLLKAKRQRLNMADVQAIDIRPHVAPVYYPMLDDIAAGEHTIYNLPGGRGSAKSSAISLQIVDGVAKDETGQTNAIVFRAVGETLLDSVYAQICWAIDQLGMSDMWNCTTKPMRCVYAPTGAMIMFRGLDKPEKLKSIKPRQGRFKYIWFEEFCELPGEGFSRSVIQSVMRGKGPRPIVFRSFNPPISRNAWANKAIAKPDRRAYTIRTTYLDVPPDWLGEAFIEEAERLKEINPRAYQHEYMGEAVGSGSDVFENLIAREITDKEIENMRMVYQGVDFGFFPDPTAFVRVAYDQKTETIYLLDEIYAKSMRNTVLAATVKERGYHNWKLTGDCADPRSIADLRDNGITCQPCRKFAGCVQYRLRWLQHRKIVIDPKRTPEAYREFTEYSYKTDRNGEVLPELVEGAEHTVDALAYSLDGIIYARYSAA